MRAEFSNRISKEKSEFGCITSNKKSCEIGKGVRIVGIYLYILY